MRRSRRALILALALRPAAADGPSLAQRLFQAAPAERESWLAGQDQQALTQAAAELLAEAQRRFDASDYAPALARVELARGLAERLGSAPLRLEALLLESRCLYRTSQFERARPRLEEARALAGAARDAARESDALRMRADIDEVQGQLDLALSGYAEALRLAEAAHDAERQSKVLRARGWTLSSRGEHAAAREAYEQACARATASGLPSELSACETSLGVLAKRLGRLDEAEEHLARAVELGERAGPEFAVAARVNLANARVQRGDLLASLEPYERALAFYESVGNGLWTAALLDNLGNTLEKLGRSEEALERHERARALRERLGAPDQVARSLANIAAVQFRRGDLQAALQAYLAALEIHVRLGQSGGVGRLQGNLADVYAAQGRPDLARDYARQAIATLEPLNEAEFVIEAQLRLGTLSLAAREWDEAERFGSKGLARAEASGLRPAAASAHGLLGRVAEARGRTSAARREYEAAREIHVRSSARVLAAEARLRLARLDSRDGRWEQALRAANEVAALGASETARSLMLEAHLLAGHAQRALGARPLAQSEFEAAARAAEELRQLSAGELTDRQRAFESRVAPYLALLELAAEAGDGPLALAHAERVHGRVLLDVLRGDRRAVSGALPPDEQARARALEEELVSAEAQVEAEAGRPAPDALRLARLRDRRDAARREHEAYRTALVARRPELRVRGGELPTLLAADAARQAGATTLLLEYALGERQAWGVAVAQVGGRSETRVVRLAQQRPELEAECERLRAAIAARDLRSAALARRLYATLLAPFEDLLRGRDALVVVPDGALWGVPFQALLTPRGAPLLAEMAVAYAPSLSAWAEMRRERAQRGPAPATLLALGAPEGSTAGGASGALALTHTRRLVEALGALYGPRAARVLLGEQASEARFKREARGYGVLQLATHGELDGAGPLYSHLRLSPGAGEDGRMEAREVLALRLDADLAVLSACETARGRLGAGEGVVGLSWAFFLAGVPRVVVSQWKVEAASTSELMLAFHHARLGRPGAGPLGVAQALRQAALRLRRDPRYRHPFYWAAFSAVGDAG